MIKATDHPVDLIIWTKGSPPQGFIMPQFRSAFQAQPANTRRVIIVTEEKPGMLMFAKRIANVLQQVFPSKSKLVFASSIEEARGLGVRTGSSASARHPAAS